MKAYTEIGMFPMQRTQEGATLADGNGWDFYSVEVIHYPCDGNCNEVLAESDELLTYAEVEGIVKAYEVAYPTASVVSYDDLI